MNDLDLYFEYRCWKGLEERGLKDKPEYRERLKYEIGVITDMGFSGYFLIVSDFARWVVSQGILPGPGRGSASASLCCYCLQITHLDPIEHGLIFERFLNPARVSQPDIDYDIQDGKRYDVIHYLEEKYGRDNVAHIGTYGTMKAKAAIRDVTRALSYPYQLGDKLAKLTLDPIAGKPQPLKESYEKIPELRRLKEKPGEAKDILDWADKVENRVKSFGTHASGVVISKHPISQKIPLYPGKEGAPTTLFEMNTVEEVGLIKFDILGLKALTTINRCVKMVSKRYSIHINPLKLPLDDHKTYETLCAGDVDGVFQMEGSPGLKRLIQQIKPVCFKDISTITAVYRPGPLESSAFQNYLQVRMGNASPQYLFPELEPILKHTDGLLVYQEDVMQICRQLAGYSMPEADNFRKIVGKKLPEKMALEHDKFVGGLQKHSNIDKKDAEQLWTDVENFAKYSFNLAHSACYGFIAYQTAYLKTHYPVEFMCSCLITDSDEPDKIVRYVSYCKGRGIDIRPPSINGSGYSFSISKDGQAIRFGLGAIKNVGKPVRPILEEREKNGEYTNFLDFYQRTQEFGVNKRQLESMTLAGVFDELEPEYNRASIIHLIEELLEHKELKKRYESKLETYKTRLEKYQQRVKDIAEWESMDRATRKGIKKPGKMKEPELPEEPQPPSIQLLPDYEKQEVLIKEKELLGYYTSGHPLDLVELGRFSIDDIKGLLDEGKTFKKLPLTAIASSVKEITTKKKTKMAYLVLEDKTGTIEATCFSRAWETVKDKDPDKHPLQFILSAESRRDEEERPGVLILDASIIQYKEVELPPMLQCDMDQARQVLLSKPTSGLTHICNLEVKTENGHVLLFKDVHCPKDIATALANRRLNEGLN